MNSRSTFFVALALTLASLSYAQVPPGDPRPPQPPLAGSVQTRVPALRFSSFPAQSVPVLGRLPDCDGIRPNNAPCRRNFQQVPSAQPPDRQIPAVELQVITAGGIAPVRITFDAGQYSDYFELITPPPTGTSAPGSAVSGITPPPGAGVAIGGPKLAEATRRIVRFKGFPNWSGAPQEIAVRVQATDGQGTVINGNFRLYPYSPLLESAAAPSIAFLNSAPRFELAQIGAATEVYVFDVTSQCGWYEQDSGVTLRGAVNIEPRTGRFSLRRRGIIRDGSNCDFTLALRFRFPGQPNGASELAGFTETEVKLRSATFPLTPPQTYRITNTWQLKERFDWFGQDLLIRSGVGVCRGKSEPGGHDVGILQIDGDLSFKIRSGPIGTRCNFLHPTAKGLPDGMHFVSSKWKATPTEKCRAPDMPGAESTMDESAGLSYNFGRDPSTRAPVIGQVSGFGNPLMDPKNPGVILFEPGTAISAHRTVLRPLEVRLECDMTAINDHSVRLTLEEITFSGPPGLSFP